MQQLTNEEIARVFAMYLGVDVRLEFAQGWNPQPVEQLTINNISDERVLNGELLLTPLSAITEEDAIEVSKSAGYIFQSFGKVSMLTIGKDLCSCLSENVMYRNGDPFDFICVYQYLIQQGYAVPLFFGINHWANGKTAIELGIAVEKINQPLHTPAAG